MKKRKIKVNDRHVELYPRNMNYEKWIDPMNADEFRSLVKAAGMTYAEVSCRMGFARNKVMAWGEGLEVIPFFVANYMRCWWKLWNIHNFSKPNPIKVYYKREYPRESEDTAFSKERYRVQGHDEDLKLKTALFLRGKGLSLRAIGLQMDCSHTMVKLYLKKAEEKGLVEFEGEVKEEFEEAAQDA